MTTVWKLLKFTPTLFLQNLRESSGFNDQVTKGVISRNIESEFLIFSHCAGETYFSAKQSFVMKQSCSGRI